MNTEITVTFGEDSDIVITWCNDDDGDSSMGVTTSSDIVFKANFAFDFGRWREAFTLYNEAYRLNPSCGHVLFRLGVMYHTGWSEKGESILKQNDEKADQFFAQALEELKKLPDDPEALCDLGYMHESGYGTTKNPKEAVRYYMMSAEMGYSRGQCNLAFMYEYGEGCEKDPQMAELYYTLSANQGLARGQCNLGYMYNNRTGSNYQKKAEEYYKMAAHQGYSKAQYNLALLYHQSHKKLAVKYFLLASEQGHCAAQRCLNKIFNGTEGSAYQYAGVQYLSEEWPDTHLILNEDCRRALLELWLLLNRHYQTLLVELRELILKQVICYWDGLHFVNSKISCRSPN